MELWRKSPLVDAFLRVAHENHEGHALLDYAVIMSIAQNFANRRYITVGSYPITVNFLLSGGTGIWARSAIDYGFSDFLKAYFVEQEIASDWLQRFLRVDGQNTVAGLMDSINSVSDDWQRQIVTTFATNAFNVFQTYRGGRTTRTDLSSFFDNLFSGTPNIRRVREGGSRKKQNTDSVEHPIVNAAWSLPQKDLPSFFAQIPVAKRLLLLCPKSPDREPRFGFPHGGTQTRLHDAFSTYLNFLELNQGTPAAPTRMQVTAEANDHTHGLLQKAIKGVDEGRAEFYSHHRKDLVLLAGLGALLRLSLKIELPDVQNAYGLLEGVWDAQTQVRLDDDDVELTINQRQRGGILERLRDAIRQSGKKGLTKSDFYAAVGAFKHFTRTERDEFIEGLDDGDDEEIFSLVLVTGKQRSTRFYFSTRIWSLAEAALELPIERPVQPDIGVFQDVLGNTHARLEDCHGYRPEWATE